MIISTRTRTGGKTLSGASNAINAANSSNSVWIPSNEGTVKCNVDGATISAAAGCGGELRLASGEVRAMFSGPVPNQGSDLAELMAIKIALEVFVEAIWVGKTTLIVDSNFQRERNAIADYLAKSGVKSDSLFKAWW